MMNALFFGLTFGTVGKVMVVLAVLHMHHSLIVEHKIDKKVLLSYKQERVLTIIGLLLIVLGYAMEVYFYGLTPLLTCDEAECAALLFGSVSN